MANKIGIVIAADGEAKFSQAMRNCTTSTKNLQKDLRTLKSDFKENANSMEYLTQRQNMLKTAQDNYKKALDAAKSGLSHQKSVYKDQQKSLDELKKKLEEAKKAVKDYEKAGDTSSKEYKDAIKVVEDYNKAIDKQSVEIQKSEGKLNQWEHTVNSAQHELNSCNTAVAENARYLNEAANSADGCATSIDKFGREIKEAGNEADTADSKMSSMFDQIKTGALEKVGHLATQALAKLGEKAIEAAKYVIDVGSTFEASMSKVEALSGATGTELDALKEKASTLGRTTQFSASEAADALSNMALAGWSTKEMLSGIDGVLNLAAAGGMDLATAADTVAGYLAAFNMKASESSKLADMMATAQARSKTTTDQLAEAYGTCATNLTQVGQDASTTTALLEGLASVNDTGSAAGTKLSAVMAQITKKMEDGAIKIGDTKVAITDSSGAFRDMVDVIADVEAATSGMTAEQRNAALQQIFNRQSMAGMNELLAVGSTKLREYKTELENSDGAAAEMARTMNDNLKGKMKELNSATEGLGNALYDKVSGPLTGAVQIATNLINGITDAITTQKSELENFISDIRTSNEASQKLVEEAEQDLANAEAKQNELEVYKNTILELQGVLEKDGKLDTFQLYRMKTAVENVSGVVPQIGKNFDETTGKVNLTKEAIANLITQAQETAMETAITSALQKDLEAMTAASFDFEKATIAAENAQKNYDYWSQKQAESANESANQMGLYKTELDEATRANNEAQQALKEVSETQEQATKDYELAQAAAERLTEKQEQTAKGYSRLVESGELAAGAVDDTSESMDAAGDSAEDLEGDLDSLSKEEDEAAKATEAHAERMENALRNAAETIKGEFETMKQAIENSFAVDLGSEFDGGLDQTVEQMIENLDSQIEGMENYAANLQTVSEHVGQEIAPEFMEYLESMGADGANILAHIVKTFEQDNGPEVVKQLSDKYMQSLQMSGDISDVGAANVTALKQMLGKLGSTPEEWSGISQAVNQKLRKESGENIDAIRESFSGAVQEAQAMGVQIPEGLAEGIESNDDPEVAVKNATSELHSAILGHVRGLAEIAEEAGIEVPKGIKEGIEGYSGEIGDAYTALLQLLADNNIEVGEQATQAIAEGTENASHEVSNAAETVAQDAADSAENQKSEFKSAGETSGSEYASGVSSSTSDAVNAAANLASSALSAAQSYENAWYSLGVNLAQGIGRGLQSQIQSIANQAANLVRQTLQAAKNEGGVASPSKKWKKELGEMLGKGTALGIKQSAKETAKAAEYVMGKTLAAASKYARKHKFSLATIEDMWQKVGSYEISRNFGILSYTTKTKKENGKEVKVKTAKGAQTYYGEILAAAEKYMDHVQTLYKVSDKQELAYWQKVIKRLKRGTDAWYDAKSKINELNASMAETVAEKADEKRDKIVSNAEETVEKLKRNNNLTLNGEIKHWEKTLKAIKKGTTQYKETIKKIAELKADVGKMSSATALLDGYTSFLELSEKATVEYWDIIRQKYKEGTDDRIEADKKYYEAKKAYNEKLKSIEDDYAEKIKEKNEEYTEALADRKNTIMDAYGLFDVFESNSATGEELLFNLQAQAAGYEEWSKSIDELEKRGIFSPELMKVLTDKGPQEIAAIKALLMLTDEQLKQYQTAYDRKSAAADKQAEEDTATLKKTIEDEVETIRSQQRAETEKANTALDSGMKYLAGQIKEIDEQQAKVLGAKLAEVCGGTGDGTLSKAIKDQLNIATLLDTALAKHYGGTSTTTSSGSTSTGSTTKTTTITTAKATVDKSAVSSASKTLSAISKQTQSTAGGLTAAQIAASEAEITNQIRSIINSAKDHTKLTAAEKKYSDLWLYIQNKYKKSLSNANMESIGSLLGIATSKTVTAAQKTSILSALKKRGLATGTRYATGGLEWMDELGPELIIRKSDNAILTRLKAGDSVIPANLTDNLWKWGALNPDTLGVASGAEMNARLASAFQAQAIATRQNNEDVLASLATIIGYLPAIANGMSLSIDGRELASATGEAMSRQLAAQSRRRR